MRLSERDLKRKIERVNEQLIRLEKLKKEDSLSNYGYWELGYYSGISYALEEILSEITL